MKIPVIFIAAVMAVSGSRVVRTYESPFFFESAPPPLSSSRSRPPSFLSTFSSRPDSFLQDSPSFGEDASIFSEGPPTPSEGKVYFDSSSSYFPTPRRPQHFYRDNGFKEESSVLAHDYRGPPPPMPNLSEDLSRSKIPLSIQEGFMSGKLMSQEHRLPPLEQQLHEHRGLFQGQQYHEYRTPSQHPHQHEHRGTPQEQQFHENRMPSLEQQLQEQLQHQMTRIPEEFKAQQPKTTTPSPTMAERQQLSFGGHSGYLSYGNHGLGFASVAGGNPDISSNQVSGNHHSLGFASISNSPELNPLAIAEMTTTTRMNPTSTISIQKQQSSSNTGIEVSQRQPVTSSPMPEPTTASPSTTEPKMSPATSPTSTMKDSDSTTPMVTPKSNLDPIQSTQNHRPVASVMFREQPRTSYSLGTITQEYPPIAHGQLPIEPSRQQIPDFKQNLLFYEAKSSYPFLFQQQQQQQQLQEQQIHQSGQQPHQSSNDNNNATPVRFSIPTVPIASISSNVQSTPESGPMKFIIQGALDLSRTPLALSTASQTNSYIPGQNHLEITQSGKANSNQATNTIPSTPSYYFVQGGEQTNSQTTKLGQGIPLGSFYLLPNNEQFKQTVQTNPSSPHQGLQLQLGGFGGVEYISSPGNSESMRVEIGKGGSNLQEHLRSLEPVYAKLQGGQIQWQ